MAVKIYSNPAAAAEYEFPVVGGLSTGWAGGMEAMTEGLDFRSELTVRKWAAGGVLTGDNLLSARQITVAGYLSGPTKAELMVEINSMKNACYRGNHNHEQTWLSVSPYDTAPYHQVYKITGVRRFDVEWITNVAAEISVSFVTGDPFRYDRWKTRYPASTAPAVQLILNSGNSYTRRWTLTLPAGVAQIQIPELLITKYAGDLLDALIIRNLSVLKPNGLTAQMNFGGLGITGTAEPDYRGLYIDCGAATVSKVKTTIAGVIDHGSAIDYMKKFTGGDFLWLQPGDNVLEFRSQNSSEVGIRVQAWVRERYL